ncbi:3-oxoacyl-[acyl-carrier-protein] synthase 3 [Pontiella desulfatans]|uniref:Beta-ketoacyl-[acyl-carrier-protein] synthase III n=1 Tax=Pontiella desulfatans TaxID=2750659 RepID=A0A6C2TVV4_PONDE|nr:beta-ketoacyl-ACP synthase III [Pontiella desulfatans]VGO11634.1 3-oxoacyl-[acyl-carrier-protein] synthase 3 [Pontiella desulfatans]
MEPKRTVSIIGTGSYVPEKVLTNHDLEEMVDTSDEWIHSRTGMRERHIAAENQAASDLGAEAAQKALADAGIRADEIDLIVVATLSPDMFFPSTACFVQEKIGAKNAYCYDLGAACSGFLYALDNAKNQIASGAVETALVIGTEKMSAFLDWEDRTTCILFGDGAGAAVLRASDEGRGIMKSVMGSDGSLAELLQTPGGGSRNPMTHGMLDQKQQFLRMQGRDVFKHAVTRMTESVVQALEKNGVSADEVKCFIPHQANIRIIDAIAKRLKVADRMYTNVDKYANTSSAALAIALDEAVKDGTIAKGDLVVLTVFGGGFTWGANVLEWGK